MRYDVCMENELSAAERRITVNLRPDSADALVWLTAHLRLGKTDVINRELRRGALLEKEIAAGSVLLIRNQSGETRQVMFL